MADQITIKIESEKLTALLKKLISRAVNRKPAMRRAAGIMHEAVEENFRQEGRPNRWQALAPSTIKQREREGTWPGKILQRHGSASITVSSFTKKDGTFISSHRRRNAKEMMRKAKSNISLIDTITRHSDATSAIVGTNCPYAAIHQFGGQAGRGLKVHIPARPFFKLESDDMDKIARMFERFLTEGL